MSCCGLPFPLPWNAFHFLPGGGFGFTHRGGSDCSAGSELCEQYFPPTAFSFQMKHNSFLRESTHVESPRAFKFLACWEWHLNDGWIPNLSPVRVQTFCGARLSVGYTETPSILGRRHQRVEIGLEYENASPKLGLMISAPQFLTSPYKDCAVETPRCWEVTVSGLVAAAWVKFEMHQP